MGVVVLVGFAAHESWNSPCCGWRLLFFLGINGLLGVAVASCDGGGMFFTLDWGQGKVTIGSRMGLEMVVVVVGLFGGKL